MNEVNEVRPEDVKQLTPTKEHEQVGTEADKEEGQEASSPTEAA